MKGIAIGSWVFAITMWVVVFALPDGGWSAKREQRWAEFKAQHQCKLVERWAGNVGTDDQGSYTSYLCDDGVKYRR